MKGRPRRQDDKFRSMHAAVGGRDVLKEEPNKKEGGKV